jgi:uncharacterized membrane protein
MLNRVVKLAALAAGGVLLSKQWKKRQDSRGQPGQDLSTVVESIEVNLPLRTVYDQWTQFEDFPQFMASVQEVKQLDYKRLHWKATVGGKQKEWDSEITEQLQDTRIAWRSTSGVRNSGEVSFDKLSENCSRVTLRMVYEPEGPAEQIGDALGAVRIETRANLQRFKEMLEKRGSETGAWRGSIQQH